MKRLLNKIKLFCLYLHTFFCFKLGFSVWNRACLTYLLNMLNLRGEGAEVGVSRALFSDLILANSVLKIYSIDLWKDSDDICREATLKLNKYGPRSNILRRTSEEAAVLFKDNSLDFVFIDGDHSYEAVNKDIELWYPKVKKGGIFSGHDYLDNDLYGVKIAVDEFIKTCPNKLYITSGSYPTWYLIK